jgi:predicted small metal-binding protein
MTFHLSCGDVMPGCPTTFTDSSQEGLLAQVLPHAAAAHGITEVTPEIAEQVTAKIRMVD